MLLSPTLFRDKTPRHVWHRSRELGQGEDRIEGIRHIEDSRFAGSVVESGLTGEDEVQTNVLATSGELAAVAHLMQRDPEAAAWRMHEVRSGNRVTGRYLRDAAFRRKVFQEAGWQISGTSLTYPSHNYEEGVSAPSSRYETTDITQLVELVQGEIAEEIAAAARCVKETDIAQVPGCKRPHDCDLPEVCFPGIEKGAYTVFDILRINPALLEELLALGIVNIDDIEDPFEFDFTQAQIEQIFDAQNRIEMVDTDKLAEMFKKVEFPVYFLDYEGYQPSKPMYDGFEPRQTVVYQYSLHILEDPDKPAKIVHREFLSDGKQNPHVEILARLQKEIGPKGSVVVHHKQYEATRHVEMAKMFPEHAEFLLGLNERIFDLEEVFLQGAWKNWKFKGRTSIKPIVETTLPGFSYKKLNIGKGDIASEIWGIMVHTGDRLFKEGKIADSLEYCGRDTMVMVGLFLMMMKHLKSVDKRTWKA